MVVLDDAVIQDPARIAAAVRCRRSLPAMPMSLNAMAELAAQLMQAPMAVVTLVGAAQEHFAGVHRMPEGLVRSGHAPIAYSVCKYVVSADRPVGCADMLDDDDTQLRGHPLAVEYGIRAFLGVPLRDSGGLPVGALSVFDHAARRWPSGAHAKLVAIAKLLASVPADDARMSTASSVVATLDSASLLDSVQEAFLAVDVDGVIVGWNRAAESLLGFTAAEVCGRHLDDSLLPDYEGRPIGAALGRLFGNYTGQRVSRQVSVRHRDGHRLRARASLSVIRGAAGALACVFLTDLSGHAAAEDEAERHSSFLAALLDSLSVGVIACDADGRVVLINRTLRDAFELPATGSVAEEHAAAAQATLCDTDGVPISPDRTPLMRALRGELVDDSDVLIRAPGKPVRTFAANGRPILGVDGRLRGAVVAAHEVTAMRRVERFRACHDEVARSLARAATLAQAAPGILRTVSGTLGWPHAELWVIDDVTGTLESVGEWSEPDGHFTELLGHTVRKGAGITGRVWATGQPLWVPDVADPSHLATDEARARAETCIRLGLRTVLSVPVRDGTTMFGVLTCYAGAPEHDGDVLTVLLDGVAAQIGVFVARRRAEELARQLVRSRDDFISLVGHEMRTPLTSIAAYTALLVENAAALDEDDRQMVQAVERNTATLRGIVDSLLDLAGLEAGHLPLTRDPVDLSVVVADAVAAAQAAAADGGVHLHTHLAPGITLNGDAARLRQVADHLLSNAVAYSPRGGAVHVHLDRNEQTVELRVTDAGIGIPADERRRLFDRFYRASNVAHQGTKGAGLGLSLVDAIVRGHDGSISFTAPGPVGTSVLVRLPAGRAVTGT